MCFLFLKIDLYGQKNLCLEVVVEIQHLIIMAENRIFFYLAEFHTQWASKFNSLR